MGGGGGIDRASARRQADKPGRRRRRGFCGGFVALCGCGGGVAFAFWSSSGVIGTRVVCAL
jgi:hypothetical protein